MDSTAGTLEWDYWSLHSIVFQRECLIKNTFGFTGKRLYANKVVLSTRCDVMTRMFSGNFKESKSELTEIEIPNFTTESFLLFLEYLYSDHVNFENADVFEVLKIADMYCQTRLLTLCEYCVSRKARSWTLRKRADLVFQVLLCVQVGQGQRSRMAMSDNLVSTRLNYIE